MLIQRHKRLLLGNDQKEVSAYTLHWDKCGLKVIHIPSIEGTQLIQMTQVSLKQKQKIALIKKTNWEVSDVNVNNLMPMTLQITVQLTCINLVWR